MERERTDLDDAAIALARHAQRAEADPRSHVLVEAATRYLRPLLVARLRRRYPGLGPGAEDVAAATLGRFVVHATTGKLEDHPNPGAYLVVIEHNEAMRYFERLDHDRAEDRAAIPGALEPDDDDLERVTERVDAERDVDATIRAAWQAGDFRGAGVLQAYVDLARTEGASPSNRQVAAEAGVTHPVVADVLRYARAWLRTRGEWVRLPLRRVAG